MMHQKMKEREEKEFDREEKKRRVKKSQEGK